MHFEIVDVFVQDAHLVVVVVHYHPDGSPWFLENYQWQGREGLRRCIKKNARGEFLMDNGVAATALTAGREWARETECNLDERAILHTVQQIHNERVITGWPQGQIDVLPRIPAHKIARRDRDGVGQLRNKLNALKGRVVWRS